MAESARQRQRAIAMLKLARFVIRNRLGFAIAFGLLTAFFAFPIVNTVLAAAGHRLPGPVLHLRSAAHPHEAHPHAARPHRSPRTPAVRTSDQHEGIFHV